MCSKISNGCLKTCHQLLLITTTVKLRPCPHVFVFVWKRNIFFPFSEKFASTRSVFASFSPVHKTDTCGQGLTWDIIAFYGPPFLSCSPDFQLFTSLTRFLLTIFEDCIKIHFAGGLLLKMLKFFCVPAGGNMVNGCFGGKKMICVILSFLYHHYYQ